MKSVFTLNTLIEQALDRSGIRTEQLVNAVQASLNSANQVKEESRRGNVKLAKKESLVRFNESTTTAYEGKTDAPAKFARWHDAQARVFKVCGDPGIFSTDCIPTPVATWVFEKFGPDAKSKGNGKHRRNGDVKPNVPTPAAPTA